MDAAEFVEVGGKIVELGGKLQLLKNQRTLLDDQISAMEAELVPLLSRHTELVSSVMGTAMPKPSTAPVALPTVAPVPNERLVLITRIRSFLKDAENVDGGISATQIADALHVDPAIVREILRSLPT